MAVPAAGLDGKGGQQQQQQQQTLEAPPPPPPLPPLRAPSLVPAAWQDAVRVLGRDQVREATVVLAHAFAADALSRYLVTADHDHDDDEADADGADADVEATWRLHVRLMAYTVAAVARNGVVAAALGPDGVVASVALWLPPGRVVEDGWTVLRSGMWRLRYQLPPEGRRRYYAELLPLLHRTKAEVMAEVMAEVGGSSRPGSGSRCRRHPQDDSYYLLYLGTKPGARRRGHAQRLLEHMFPKADAENRPIYLESSGAANNAFYEKFGFVRRRDVALVRGPVPVTLSIMVRMPRALSSSSKPQPGEAALE